MNYFDDNELCECGHTWRVHRESIGAEVCGECACWWFCPDGKHETKAEADTLPPDTEPEAFGD